ncbi:MAG: selenocysteine-specific translation elongation factor [Armatimonadetes bacterium]|nr:selenocysteine-specific translation elongation factor [Armatimonadota bacterium]
MDSKHLIMGTAGHVDHGKTALIKALTGFDCDTHKQEKQRGITINLGFTHLDLPEGNSIGIVDMPGHSDFIKTMVSGASGIDFVLLVISGDESIMPQTREHLAIMQILGIKYGLIALTKIDLIDEELSELAESEIHDFVKGTFLENSPIIKVSSQTNYGISEMIQAISEIVKTIPEKNSFGTFRMFIDRIFIQPGFGIIVNGSVLSGSIQKENLLYLLPTNKEVRIRRIEHHGKEVEQVKAGDRASLNLVGFKKKDFKRGMVLTSKLIKATSLIDANFQLFQNDVSLGLWNQILFLMGTVRLMARIHLLDKNVLKRGESGLIQIYLPQSIIAQIDDSFILRNSSGTITLGGGKVIDPYPLHHRRRRKEQIENVEKLAKGEHNELIAVEVRKSLMPITDEEIAEKLNIQKDDLIPVIFQDLPKDIVFFQTKDKILLMEKKKATALKNKILTQLIEFHKKNPLLEQGKTFNELTGLFGNQKKEIIKLILELILQDLEENQKVKKVNKTWIIASHKVELNERFKAQINEVEEKILLSEKKVTDFQELASQTENENLSILELKQILAHLISTQKIYFIQMKYIHSDFMNESRQKLISYLNINPQGITVSHFRDLMKINRANALILLGFFDTEGITIRKGDVRVLTKKFLKNSYLDL